MSDNFPQAVAAYKHYDVLLVNAIFDGMNLIAKEAPLVNERDGVLILSENAGALRGADRLGDGASTRSTSSSRRTPSSQALTMPAEERNTRIEGIRAQVREHDIARWIDTQLADLKNLA